jgi:phage-related protein
MAFNVDENGILQPLGVTVLRGVEFITNTVDYGESVPGRDGEYDFGCDLGPKLINIPVAIETTPSTWADQEAEIMGYLNPKLGLQSLTFANRPGKVYMVRYVGTLGFQNKGLYHRKFTLPFKVFESYGIASTQSLLEGSGTAVNSGNDVCPIVVEIVGPVTNPSVTVAGKTMTYTGTVTANDKLIIDTEKLTCTFNGVNALANYNGVFPKLAVGDNTVTAASAGTTQTIWLNRWI